MSTMGELASQLVISKKVKPNVVKGFETLNDIAKEKWSEVKLINLPNFLEKIDVSRGTKLAIGVKERTKVKKTALRTIARIAIEDGLVDKPFGWVIKGKKGRKILSYPGHVSMPHPKMVPENKRVSLGKSASWGSHGIHLKDARLKVEDLQNKAARIHAKLSRGVVLCPEDEALRIELLEQLRQANQHVLIEATRILKSCQITSMGLCPPERLTDFLKELYVPLGTKISGVTVPQPLDS